jgi:hypothetical protein
MKLAAAMVAQTLDQYDAKVIPESHAAVTELSQRFGDHTFFIDESGLSIVEPRETDEPHQTGVVVNLASYNDDRSELQVHAPKLTDIVVELGPPKPRDPSAA